MLNGAMKTLLEMIVVNANRVKSMTVKHSAISLILPALLCSSLFLTNALAPHAHAAGNIVKWKDDKGATHYGDNVPAQYANTENSVINKQGITVKRNRPANHRDVEADTAKLEQDKKDKVLLNAFTNANEIDLARDRNLQFDQAVIDDLLLQKNNGQKKLTKNLDFADNLTKKNKPIPAELTAEIKNNQVEVAKQNKLLNEHKTEMESKRKRFDDDKVRFIALKNKGNGL